MDTDNSNFKKLQYKAIELGTIMLELFDRAEAIRDVDLSEQRERMLALLDHIKEDL